MSHNNFGMNARHSHKETSEEMKEIFKQNGSLSDYQNNNKNNNIDEELAESVLKFS